MKTPCLRFSSLFTYLALLALGVIVPVSHISAAPQNQTASDLLTTTIKAPAQTTSITPAAPRPAPTRRNCGTVWTGLIDDPNADVNPCQKGCERGEQRQVKTYKTGDTTRYDVNYQCYLMVPAPRPVVASAISRKKCGTAWTGWIDAPNAEVNPCSKGCEPGEQQIVDAGINGGVKKYNVRYQCYVEVPPKMGEKYALASTIRVSTLTLIGSGPTANVAVPEMTIAGVGPTSKVAVGTMSLFGSGPTSNVMVQVMTLTGSGPTASVSVPNMSLIGVQQ